MAELAGLVLGGLPIVLYAIDNYHRCLQATTDYWRYESTLKLIRSHVFVQQQQLQITLRSIGLVDPTPSELEEHLRHRYPDKFATFADIISRMERLLVKLLDKLDVDVQGKPKWTTEPPERAVWEWKRVRRGFGRSSRQKLIDELQFWNDALKNCFEKTEVPLENDTPTAASEAIRSKFSITACNNTRRRAARVHDAISRAWRCQTHEEHLGNLKLSWHTDGEGLAAEQRLSLVFSPGGGESLAWYEVACDVVETVISQDTGGPASHPSPQRSSPASRPLPSSDPRPWRRLRGLFQPSNEATPQDALHVTSSIAIPIQLAGPPAPQILQNSNALPEVNCLCSFFHSSTRFARLSNQGDDNQDLQVRMERMQQSRLVDAISVSTIFNQTRGSLTLSRKDRFGIAAAAAWAVLNLAGSPWIGSDWDGKNGLQLLMELQALRYYPAISHAFRRPGGDAPPPNSSPLHSSVLMQEHDPFGTGFIRNKTLFVLAILFIELCLNKPFEKLRQEFYSSSLTASLGIRTETTGIDDFEVANMCMQRVYLEAGDLYGYAVQRCLRCEFPGRDVTKSFEFEQFRKDFFHGVVAPVQATFNLLQAMDVNTNRV
ncbi:hypothetical protein QBC42DRAFT_276307 [Cladorrhinum samala]|uniref:DUF7580 domain-containing protein n=1 Tax=Cladorrhinum samala TaxID=585594 RepID=A0AAV9HDE5_9PEZI|nr:hypothetical protein QBC42DRAFT_276307 [Cladorrhinum samala]